HASDEFRRGERLDQIVVCASRKATHPITLLAPRRQHDGRQALCFWTHTQAAAKLDSRYGWHHPVEDEKVGHIFLQAKLCLITPGDDLNLIAFCFQIIAQQDAQRLVVFHDHDLGSNHIVKSLDSCSTRPAWDAGPEAAVRSECSRRFLRCW